MGCLRPKESTITGETHITPSGWSPDTLKILEDEKIAALERLLKAEIRRLDEALAAQDRAVVLLNTANQIAQDKFEATVERDSVKQNEFRGSLDDLGKTMATRRELETATLSIAARLDDLAKQLGDLRSRIDVGPTGLQQLQAAQAQAQGRQSGINASVGMIFAVIAATGAVLSIVIILSNVLTSG